MKTRLKRILSAVTALTLFWTSIDPVHAAESVSLPVPGALVLPSPDFSPASLLGLTVYKENGLKFDFLVHQGDSSLNQEDRKGEYDKLIRYFLSSLTIPDKDQWVNLSPVEKDRLIAPDFGTTEMGRDLLAQDYILKQLTSSLMHPDSSLGKAFWHKVYTAAWQRYGTTDVPVDTFNKVWIVPDKAAVYESGQSVVLLSSHLKVMLEEDYAALNASQVKRENVTANSEMNKIGSEIVRAILLPAIEREVNEGRNFASLRQIVSGMILATWYKKALKDSLLGMIYADKAKVKGIDQNPKNNDAIYEQYLEAFRKGVFNFIKEDHNNITRETILHKYFAGGFTRGNFDRAAIATYDVKTPPDSGMLASFNPFGAKRVTVGLTPFTLPLPPVVDTSTVREASDIQSENMDFLHWLASPAVNLASIRAGTKDEISDRVTKLDPHEAISNTSPETTAVMRKIAAFLTLLWDGTANTDVIGSQIPALEAAIQRASLLMPENLFANIEKIARQYQERFASSRSFSREKNLGPNEPLTIRYLSPITIISAGVQGEITGEITIENGKATFKQFIDGRLSHETPLRPGTLHSVSGNGSEKTYYSIRMDLNPQGKPVFTIQTETQPVSVRWRLPIQRWKNDFTAALKQQKSLTEAEAILTAAAKTVNVFSSQRNFQDFQRARRILATQLLQSLNRPPSEPVNPDSQLSNIVAKQRILDALQRLTKLSRPELPKTILLLISRAAASLRAERLQYILELINQGKVEEATALFQRFPSSQTDSRAIQQLYRKIQTRLGLEKSWWIDFNTALEQGDLREAEEKLNASYRPLQLEEARALLVTAWVRVWNNAMNMELSEQQQQQTVALGAISRIAKQREKPWTQSVNQLLRTVISASLENVLTWITNGDLNAAEVYLDQVTELLDQNNPLDWLAYHNVRKALERKQAFQSALGKKSLAALADAEALLVSYQNTSSPAFLQKCAEELLWQWLVIFHRSVSGGAIAFQNVAVEEILRISRKFGPVSDQNLLRAIYVTVEISAFRQAQEELMLSVNSVSEAITEKRQQQQLSNRRSTIATPATPLGETLEPVPGSKDVLQALKKETPQNAMNRALTELSGMVLRPGGVTKEACQSLKNLVYQLAMPQMLGPANQQVVIARVMLDFIAAHQQPSPSEKIAAFKSLYFRIWKINASFQRTSRRPSGRELDMILEMVRRELTGLGLGQEIPKALKDLHDGQSGLADLPMLTSEDLREMHDFLQELMLLEKTSLTSFEQGASFIDDVIYFITQLKNMDAPSADIGENLLNLHRGLQQLPLSKERKEFLAGLLKALESLAHQYWDQRIQLLIQNELTLIAGLRKGIGQDSLESLIRETDWLGSPFSLGSKNSIVRKGHWKRLDTAGEEILNQGITQGLFLDQGTDVRLNPEAARETLDSFLKASSNLHDIANILYQPHHGVIVLARALLDFIKAGRDFVQTPSAEHRQALKKVHFRASEIMSLLDNDSTREFNIYGIRRALQRSLHALGAGSPLTAILDEYATGALTLPHILDLDDTTFTAFAMQDAVSGSLSGGTEHGLSGDRFLFINDLFKALRRLAERRITEKELSTIINRLNAGATACRWTPALALSEKFEQLSGKYRQANRLTGLIREISSNSLTLVEFRQRFTLRNLVNLKDTIRLLTSDSVLKMFLKEFFTIPLLIKPDSFSEEQVLSRMDNLTMLATTIGPSEAIDAPLLMQHLRAMLQPYFKTDIQKMLYRFDTGKLTLREIWEWTPAYVAQLKADIQAYPGKRAISPAKLLAFMELLRDPDTEEQAISASIDNLSHLKLFQKRSYLLNHLWELGEDFLKAKERSRTFERSAILNPGEHKVVISPHPLAITDKGYRHLFLVDSPDDIEYWQFDPNGKWVGNAFVRKSYSVKTKARKKIFDIKMNPEESRFDIDSFLSPVTIEWLESLDTWQKSFTSALQNKDFQGAREVLDGTRILMESFIMTEANKAALRNAEEQYALAASQEKPDLFFGSFLSGRTRSTLPASAPGGIDLNAANLDLSIRRDGSGVPLPLAQQDMAQLEAIPGLVPVILTEGAADNLPILAELQSLRLK